MKKIAIIPARSGSKGLKNKNIINLCGKPLMAYTIESAIKCDAFDRIIVSTDSEKYGKIALSFGAEVLYRNETISSDSATTYMVILDVLKKTENNFDYFVLLQPTSPLRSSKHILEAVDMFERRYKEFDFLVSVCAAKHSSVLVKPLDSNGGLSYFDTDFANYRRQNFEEYSPNGAIFIGKNKQYILQKHFFGEKSMAYIMPDEVSIDIDNEFEYRLAYLLMKDRANRI